MTETAAETIDRKALVEGHVELVRYLARRIAKDLPGWMERDDLISYGWFGLIDAAERFDPERGVKFQTFATPRIRGAILDGLRDMDWAPRSVRSAARAVAQATEQLNHDLGRPPSVTEIAEHLGLAESEAHAAKWEESVSYVDSLHGSQAGGEEDHHDHDVPHAPSSDHAAEVEQRRLAALIAQAIVGLPADEREVVALRYGAGLSLPEVGKRMGCGRGKATALYVSACMMVRERLAVLA